MALSFKNVSDRLVILPELGLVVKEGEEITLKTVNLYKLETMVYNLKEGRIEITHPLIEFFDDITWDEIS